MFHSVSQRRIAMEITLKIEGKEKVFSQNVVNYLTIRKALDWQEMYNTSIRVYQEYINSGVDGEPDPEILEEAELPDDYTMLKRTADLAITFYDGQFTFDEFVSGYYVNSIQEFYAIGIEILAEVHKTMSSVNTDTKKKYQRKKSN